MTSSATKQSPRPDGPRSPLLRSRALTRSLRLYNFGLWSPDTAAMTEIRQHNKPDPTRRPPLLTRRSAVAESIAGLFAAAGKPFAQAKAELAEAAGGGAGTDLLVLEPKSAQFAGLTQGFNRRWTAPNCARIFVPLTEAGAQQALTQALPFGPGKIRVRGGGHCYENFVFSTDTLALIDVSLLNDFGFDAQRNVFYAQSGGTNWDMYRRLYWRFGRTLPAGSCYSVGLGGHICGGGAMACCRASSA